MEFRDFLNYITITMISNTALPEIHLQLIQTDLMRLRFNGDVRAIRLGGSIHWPGTVSVNETGYTIFQFSKQESKMWDNGSVYRFVREEQFAHALPRTWPSNVINKVYLKNETCVLTCEYNVAVYNHVNPGQYLFVEEYFRGRSWVRNYFPLPDMPFKTLTDPNPVRGTPASTRTRLHLLVKSITNKTLGWHLCSKTYGSIVYLSSAEGTFNMQFVKDKSHVFLITSGVGISAMMSIMLRTLQENRSTNVTLIYYNIRHELFLFENELDDLERQEDRLKIWRSTLFADENFSGHKGLINKESFINLNAHEYQNDTKNGNYFVISGQFDFLTKMARLIETELFYPKSYIYTFVGR